MDLKTVKVVDQDGTIYHQEAQDVDPILKHVTFLRDFGQTGDGEMRHAAKIPWVVSEERRKKRGISFHQMMSDQAIAAEFLNSEEARPYRIWQGRV